MSRSLFHRLPRLWRAIRRLGILTSARYLCLRYVICPLTDLLGGRHRLYRCRFKEAAHELYLRSGSSDLQVLGQIFVHREYLPLDHLDPAGIDVVIDCGANVGYSSAWFLNRFPGCRVIAIEPDPGNFRLLEKNLEPYGERVRTKQAAVWSRPTTLSFREDDYRDGKEWSRQVVEASDSESKADEIEAIDLDSLFDELDPESRVLLKMDIEGAECVVLTGCAQSWLPRVAVLVLELHDDTLFGKASEVFRREIPVSEFDISTHDELTLCFRKPGRLE